jgi:hypothetical protein
MGVDAGVDAGVDVGDCLSFIYVMESEIMNGYPVDGMDGLVVRLHGKQN